MAGVEEMDLGVGRVPAVGLRLGDPEGRVVAAIVERGAVASRKPSGPP
jgi:hypothetical protein